MKDVRIKDDCLLLEVKRKRLNAISNGPITIVRYDKVNLLKFIDRLAIVLKFKSAANLLFNPSKDSIAQGDENAYPLVDCFAKIIPCNKDCRSYTDNYADDCSHTMCPLSSERLR